MTDVNDLVVKRVLPQSICAIADRGDENGVCLAIDVKKGTSDEEIENIINILYKKAGLESSYPINMNAITKDNAPKMYSLKGIFEDYLEFKNYIYTTKYTKLLSEAEDRLEIKNGLIKAVDVIDLIIEIIRGSRDRNMVKDCLMFGKTAGIKFRFKGSEADAKELSFTEKQVDAILAYRLERLVGLEVEALKKEYDEVKKKVAEYKKLLSSTADMQARMIDDLKSIRKKFAIPRKSVIENLGTVEVKKAEDVAVDCVMIMDRFSYVKVISEDTFAANAEKINAEYKKIIHLTTHDRIGFFTDRNTYHTVKVSDITKAQSKLNTKKKEGDIFGTMRDKGVQLAPLCEMDNDATIMYMDEISQMSAGKVLFVTNFGYVKLVEGSVFDISRKTSQPHKPEETMVYIGKVTDETDIVLKSKDGYYLRCELSEVKTMGKTAACARFFSLSGSDTVESVAIGNCHSSITVTETVGSGISAKDVEKEIPFSRLKTGKKGGKGNKLRI